MTLEMLFNLRLSIFIQGLSLTRWLPTTSILVVTGRIYRYQFKYSYLENKKFFSIFIAFLESKLNFEHFEKNGPYSSGISEVIVSERRAHLHKSLVSENPLAVNVLKLEIK